MSTDVKEIDFESSKPPTQAQFNAYHESPVEYGDDGDMAVGNQYSREEALIAFKQYEKETAGEEPEFTIEDVIAGSCGWVKNPHPQDGIGTYCFVWIAGDTKMKPLYDCWILWR